MKYRKVPFNLSEQESTLYQTLKVDKGLARYGILAVWFFYSMVFFQYGILIPYRKKYQTVKKKPYRKNTIRILRLLVR